jgi:hypothetical protein
VPLFLADDNIVRVQFRLAVIDAQDRETGSTKPPAQMAIPDGDLRLSVLQHGDDIAWLPTSGNAFAAPMLKRIFPIPESEYRICADYYLSNLSALFGVVKALDETGGYYRVHGGNSHERAELNLPQVRQLILRTQQTHLHIEHHARQLGIQAAASSHIASRSLTYLANRLLSLRLDATHHPLTHERVFDLVGRGLLAAWQRSDLSVAIRLLHTVWFLMAAVAPRAGIRWLATQYFYPQARGKWFNGLLASRRRVHPQYKLQA